MPGPKMLDPSSSPRAMLGAELRHKREAAGLSQEELGALVFTSGSFIGQLESGTRRMLPDFARRFDEILGTDGYFLRNCEAANKSRYPDHFAEAAEAEAVAQTIREYAPLLIPGLLQTEAYARSVCREYEPTAPDELIEERVAGRLERARILSDPTTPLFWGILDEAVLRRAVGGRAVMGEALRHIAVLTRSHRIIVQVLPFSAGGHPALGGGLKLMAFPDAPPLAYLEGLGTGQLLDDPAQVERYTMAYDLVGAAALSPKLSLAMIESAAKDYTDEE
ncbi:helix-turn-helix domain-containing protein [Streptomyces sp. JJ66]|uniref:helix-turn-helix domain-containing protein n=1 Tax=Streptomyces sp. JJ66 TaxID=2803843 RepID=UPI001C59C26A|nr:helix-turn-helix transcriptional regulator [Streptomyces sp. JJ66]MBW1604404.1 helix-turn-helix domain-containing protein [Streptomyces sp. JJ66]